MTSKDEKKSASPVSRSVYQKLAEENKRLKADIYSLVMDDDFEAVFDRWKKHFDQKAAIDKAMRDILKLR
jgi:hypothetical protein